MLRAMPSAPEVKPGRARNLHAFRQVARGGEPRGIGESCRAAGRSFGEAARAPGDPFLSLNSLI